MPCTHFSTLADGAHQTNGHANGRAESPVRSAPQSVASSAEWQATGEPNMASPWRRQESRPSSRSNSATQNQLLGTAVQPRSGSSTPQEATRGVKSQSFSPVDAAAEAGLNGASSSRDTTQVRAGRVPCKDILTSS